MKYAVTVDDSYKALVEIEIGSKNWSGDQEFAGRITTDKFGISQIEGGRVMADGSFSGSTSLGGNSAEFTAKVAGTAISGKLHYGPFHVLNAEFEGVETA